MIKFFRRIRQQLLTENKFSKYMLYAIGEIILVVIGIMIALQFNNLNEEKKKQQNIDQLIVDIEKDLLVNFNEGNSVLKFYRKQDSIAKLIADNKLTKEDYDNDRSLSYYIVNWEQLIPVEKNVNQFVDAEKLVAPEFGPIIRAAKEIQLYRSVLDGTWSNVDDTIDSNSKFLANFSWFVKYDSVSNSKRMAFMLKDSIYQNIALGHWSRVQNYHDKVSRYQAQSMATLATIKKFKYNYSNSDIKGLFKKNGMLPFEEYPCDIVNENLKNLKTVRESEVYGNLTKDTIYFRVTNNKDQGILEKMMLPPTTFKTISSTNFFGIDGDKNTLLTLLDKNGNCIKKFGATENGYLLIE